jgi:hypothetical protein
MASVIPAFQLAAVHHLFGQWIEGPVWTHDLFESGPGAAQEGRIVRDRFPKVGNPIDSACGHDVVVDGFHFRRGVGVFKVSECRHGLRIID